MSLEKAQIGEQLIRGTFVLEFAMVLEQQSTQKSSQEIDILS